MLGHGEGGKVKDESMESGSEVGDSVEPVYLLGRRAVGEDWAPHPAVNLVELSLGVDTDGDQHCGVQLHRHAFQS